MELEPASNPFQPPVDQRPKIVEPPPVRLVTVADARLTAVAGLEAELDLFYVGLLKFERDLTEPGIVYRAENWRIQFDLIEQPRPREEYRNLGVIVPSLADLAGRFDDAEIPYVRQRGLIAGQESLLLADPGGNLLEISESKLMP
jgi:hypothetical protein